ncbi:MAG: DUF2306 domain-containing protein [Pseudomonadota bacterium]
MWDDVIHLSAWVDSAAGTLHFFCALFALVAGPVLFLRPKRGTLHRLLGAGFILSMLAVNVSALTMFNLGRFNLFHVFAIISLATLLPGTVAISQALRTRSRLWFSIHAHCMIWAYYGLVMAGAAQVAYRTVPKITGTFASVDAFWDTAMPVSTLTTLVLTWWLVPRMVDRYAGATRRTPLAA